MKVSDLFVRCLENEGVEVIFGLGGEENLDLLDSIRASKIKYIPVRHEQAAGFMAATQGRLTGKVGVCLSTLGPGATNFLTAAAYAKLGGMPMLMITGQKPIRNRVQGNFQVLDMVGTLDKVTKFTTQISHPELVASTIRQAFRIATSERPGPVHLELPKDVATELVDDEPYQVTYSRRPVAESKGVQRAVELISKAKHPLLLIGAGANRKLTSNTLTKLIKKFHLPFFETQMGKGVLDERLPEHLGTAALLQNDFIHCAVEYSDLIVNIGHDHDEKPPFIMKRNQKVIHINFSATDISSVYCPTVEVVGDIANTIWQIDQLLTPQDTWDFNYFYKVKNALDVHLKVNANASTFPPKPQRIVSDVRQCMPENGIVCLDNGMFKLWFARYYPTYSPNTLLLDNALATMGAGLPSAIAAKLLNPDLPVIAVTGDGGFMMNSQELETAVRLKLNLVVIIINDEGLGMIRWEQAEKEFVPFGLEHNNPDFVKYAQSYSAHGHRVGATDELLPLLNKTLRTPGVHVIDLPVDYSENLKVFSKKGYADSCPAPR